MKLVRPSLIIVSITLLMLLFAEATARVLLWRSEGAAQRVEVSFGFSTSGYGDLLPNIDSVERLYPTRPYYLRTNSVGLRNVDELNPDENVLRILAIGDSFTYGFYVHNHEAFPARLEERLNELLPRRVQVLNAGIPGYTLEDEWAYLQDKGLALNPDIVILGVYTNDIFDLHPTMRQYFARNVVLAQAQTIATPSGVREWLQNNVALYSLWRLVRYGYVEWQVEEQVGQIIPYLPDMMQLYENITFLQPDSPENRPFWEKYEALLDEMAMALKERNIPLVLVAFPDLMQHPTEKNMPDVPQQFLQRITAENDVFYLDMLPVLRQAGDIATVYLMYYNPDNTGDPNAPGAGSMMYSGDGHLSVYGNLVTARTLADMLIQQGLVSLE
jgi:hypothetical protein